MPNTEPTEATVRVWPEELLLAAAVASYGLAPPGRPISRLPRQRRHLRCGKALENSGRPQVAKGRIREFGPDAQELVGLRGGDGGFEQHAPQDTVDAQIDPDAKYDALRLR